ncbi:MAG: VanZ family protein [Candidatus Sulfotelmatobacter sp.]
MYSLPPRYLDIICVLVLCGILTAGLWPFFPPKNKVSWLKNEHGLLFGDYATVFSSGSLTLRGSKPDCTLELWLQPGLTSDSNTILDFYTPEVPFKFRVRQTGDDLVLLRNYRNDSDRSRAGKVYVDHVFRKGDAVLITISASAQSTSVYVDGNLAKSIPQYGLTRLDLDGQLVLGAAPVVDDRWSGKMRGLAAYSKQLSAQEVLQHYKDWTQIGQPIVDPDNSTEVLYTFSEREGSIVHNEVGPGPNLNIPNRFTVLGQVLLMSPWKEFSPGWSYYKYVITNIAGFIPLGFLFYAYLRGRTSNSREAAFKTVFLGLLTSLTIEVLQAYIPTRQSGMTDVITNTLGTYLGVVLFQCGIVQHLVAWLVDALPLTLVHDECTLHADSCCLSEAELSESGSEHCEVSRTGSD